jgi:hypothetical protein
MASSFIARVRGRFLITTMLGAYAILNILLSVAAPLTSGWPMLGLTAVTVPPMVIVMVYIVIPLARRVERI